MKFIPTYFHGIFDYVGGAALLAAPEIFGFAEYGGPAVIIPRVLGVIVLLQSASTNYELGLFKVLTVRFHLMNDYIAAIFLALSPWIFGFVNNPSNVWVPHLLVGIAVFLVTLFTKTVPSQANYPSGRGKGKMAHA